MRVGEEREGRDGKGWIRSDQTHLIRTTKKKEGETTIGSRYIMPKNTLHGQKHARCSHATDGVSVPKDTLDVDAAAGKASNEL